MTLSWKRGMAGGLASVLLAFGALAATGWLVANLHPAQAAEPLETLPSLSLNRAMAPEWLPLDPDYRVRSSRQADARGELVLVTALSVESCRKKLEAELANLGFQVSSNFMLRDGQETTALVHAFQKTTGRMLAATLAREIETPVARVELVYSETRE